MSAYPEHDRMAAISDKSQIIGEFLEWLNYTKGIHLCEQTPDMNDHWWTVDEDPEKLLAEFFSIDLTKIEAEKRAMLAEVRAANAADTHLGEALDFQRAHEEPWTSADR